MQMHIEGVPVDQRYGVADEGAYARGGRGLQPGLLLETPSGVEGWVNHCVLEPLGLRGKRGVVGWASRLWPLAIAGLILSGCIPTDPYQAEPTPTPSLSTPTPTEPPPTDADDDGYLTPADCDDQDPAIYPNAYEVCNQKDDDCDGTVDDSPLDLDTYFRDVDGDGYGIYEDKVAACEAPEGYCDNADDCDDSVFAIHPGGAEVCNGLDDDCDTDVDEEATDAQSYYQDKDGDGFGESSGKILACKKPAGYVENDYDCNDSSSLAYPNAQELCNFLDDDCDNEVDEGMVDSDGSGVIDCREVAVIISSSFVTYEAADCDGQAVEQRELAQLTRYLEEMGLVAVPMVENAATGVSLDAISHYPLVIYHNGGVSWAGPLGTMNTLAAYRDLGGGLLFLGDDLYKQAYSIKDGYGSEVMYQLLWLKSFWGGGVNGTGAVVEDENHPVMSGQYGKAEGFAYYDDLDWGFTQESGEDILMRVFGTLYPVVVAAQREGQRTLVMGFSTFASVDKCPVTEPGEIDKISVIFKNGVNWLLAP